jgi:hypothetical protein
MGLHLENEVAVVKTPTIISNNPVLNSRYSLLSQSVHTDIQAHPVSKTISTGNKARAASSWLLAPSGVTVKNESKYGYTPLNALKSCSGLTSHSTCSVILDQSKEKFLMRVLSNAHEILMRIM